MIHFNNSFVISVGARKYAGLGSKTNYFFEAGLRS
jgi:hypothetical protein